jgi:hypothetical protein
MKKCSFCDSTYTDDTLNFCLEDGSPLSFVPDAQSTLLLNTPLERSQLPTEQVIDNVTVEPPPIINIPPDTPISEGVRPVGKRVRRKVCMLGASAVGKTSLVARYVQSIFSEKYLTTVGVKIDRKVLRAGHI